MYAPGLLLCFVIGFMKTYVQGSSESVIFTKLNKGLTPVPVVLDQKFKIDCSVNNRNVKVSLYRKLPNGKKEMVKVDGKNVKRTGDTFELVIRSYFESSDFYCRGELYGTSYEKEVKVVIIATTQELSPIPEVFPGLSKVNIGDSVKIECICKGQLSVLKWFKDGKNLTSDNKKIKIHNYFNRRRRESTSLLSISNVTQGDTGVYRCEATSKLQPGYFSFIDSKVETRGASESVIFTKLNKGLTLVPVVLDQKFKIDCSVNNRNVKVSLYRKLPNGKKEIVKVDGKNVKRTGDTFELVIKSYFESRDFYCRGELYGTSYEKEVKVVIIATTQELSPTPEVFPGLSKVNIGDSVKIECKCKGQLSILKWFKDGKSLSSDNKKIKIHNYFNRRRRESTSLLSISNVTQGDTGVYRCEATSKLQPGYFSFIDSKVETRGLAMKFI